MPNIGFAEVAIVAILALIIFGPKRLPEFGRSLGKGIREFRTSVGGMLDDDSKERPELNAGSNNGKAPVRAAAVQGKPDAPASG
jgi:sec-independent protein translocase protein TatA